VAVSEDLKSLLISSIKKHIKPSYFNGAKTELSIRCPYCGDSIKSTRSAHLYIELNNDVCFNYYCQRCNTTGIVNENFLKDIKLYNDELSVGLFDLNKNIKYHKKTKTSSVTFAKKDLTFPKLTGTEGELEKLNYFNDRLGITCKANKAANMFRVILSFEKFLDHNEIDVLTCTEEKAYLLDKYCVGFLSYDQTNIVFRSLDEKKTNFRYYIYNIFGDYEDSKRFYTIKATLDILQPQLNVVVTEGIFDIIGVYNHIYNGIADNTLFIAVNGVGYNLIFQHLARLGFLNMNITIYSDDDVDKSFYVRMKEFNPVISNNRIKIVYNKIRKDFGVKKEEIQTKYSFI
jgi:hypothetical protein